MSIEKGGGGAAHETVSHEKKSGGHHKEKSGVSKVVSMEGLAGLGGELLGTQLGGEVLLNQGIIETGSAFAPLGRVKGKSLKSAGKGGSKPH